MWRYLITLIAAVLISAVLPSEVRADVIHEGKVSSAGQGQIAIIAKNGDNKSFGVAEDAKITLNGKPAKLNDIEVGDVVTLTIKERGGKQVAVVIDALPDASRNRHTTEK